MFNNNERYKMNEYNHSDHMSVMTELLVLYKLKNETDEKILVATKKNDELNALLKKKEVKNERTI